MLSVTNTHNNQNFCQEICPHQPSHWSVINDKKFKWDASPFACESSEERKLVAYLEKVRALDNVCAKYTELQLQLLEPICSFISSSICLVVVFFLSISFVDLLATLLYRFLAGNPNTNACVVIAVVCTFLVHQLLFGCVYSVFIRSSLHQVTHFQLKANQNE